MKNSVEISLELGVWLFYTILALGSYFGKLDIGGIGILMWLVFIGGICISLGRFSFSAICIYIVALATALMTLGDEMEARLKERATVGKIMAGSV